MMFKIVSKVLIDHLKQILLGKNFEEQLSFVPDHLITINVIMAYECLLFMKRGRSKKNVYRVYQVGYAESL